MVFQRDRTAVSGMSFAGGWSSPARSTATLRRQFQRLHTAREQADYDALDVSIEDADRAVEAAARFVDQISVELRRPSA